MIKNYLSGKMRLNYLNILIIIVFTIPALLRAQTTGKISGKVIDDGTGEPLFGANVVLEGTPLGAATDDNGDYYILNIPPGIYRLKASSVGYETVIYQDLTVSVNRTTTADFKLKTSAIQSQEVVITVPRIQSKKDQTSSVRNITAKDIEELPVENLDAVVGLQAGVVRGHFRGGRSNEVAYMVDGIKVLEGYDLNRKVNVENDVIAEIEVITGTFNAEYGNAMSGVVNAITKDGSNQLKASVSLNSGNYYTPHKNVFFGVKDSDVLKNKDASLFLEGPVIQDLISFVFNGRYQDNTGPRYGIRRFMPNNFSEFTSQFPIEWYSEHTGDNAIVPLEYNKDLTLFGKLSIKPSNTVRTAISYSFNKADGKGFDHFYKYNPEGRALWHDKSHQGVLAINHTLSQSLFYEFKSSYLYAWDGDYLYENPTDPRYVHDQYGANSDLPGFSVGGQQKGWSKNWSSQINEKFDLTWQVNKNHVLKTGFDFTQHEINRFNTSVRNKYHNSPLVNDFYYTADIDTVNMIISNIRRVYPLYEPELNLDENSVFNDIFDVKPRQFAAYIQDKMEFDEMVINIGLRYDFFDPNTTYPSQYRNPGKNPDDQLSFPTAPEKMSTYLKAKTSGKLSPRFGISYKLGDIALLRFSYGHFFQLPPFFALYSNFKNLIGTSDFGTLMGNPNVKPQKTIEYETGLWMQVTNNMSVEVAVFYRDIYDLLGTDFIETFNAIKYGLYSNKDYGNARGLELKYDFISGDFSARLNYTLQYTRGNADNPRFTFDRAGSSLDPVAVLIPMSWDQRHTLNVSLSYNAENYNVSVTGRLDSGNPYTWSPIFESPLSRVHLNPYNSVMPTLFSVDLQAYVKLFTIGSSAVRLRVIVYNLLDRLNETGVNGTTGRANQTIVREIDLLSYKSNFSTIYDRNNNPGQFGNPRFIKLGLEFGF